MTSSKLECVLRYAQHPNIVWQGDFEWSPSDSMGQQVDAVFRSIRRPVIGRAQGWRKRATACGGWRP
jgi:hypothetical protein